MASSTVMTQDKQKGKVMARPKKEVKATTEEAVFFSESDMYIDKATGKKMISSEYPSWYNRQAIEELEEDMRRDEYALKMGYIKEAQMPVVRDRLKSFKKKLDEIESSFPILSDKKKDEVKLASDYLGNQIRDRMFTRSQMMKGIADSHEEAKRMITPSITVTPEIDELAKACNVTVRDGKISRDEASKIWKITRRALEESSDCEELRRD